MATVNVSKACKLAGISRTKMYADYINTGVISVTRNKQNKPEIDTSELIRVFKVLKPTVNSEQHLTPNLNAEYTHKIELLERDLAHERKTSAERLERIDELNRFLMLLSDKSEKHVSDLQESTTPKRGLFAWITGRK